MNDAERRRIWEDIGRPGAQLLRQQLSRRGVRIAEKRVREFVKNC